MDSISPYHLSVTEDGLWNVIDASTGGPAEVRWQGKCYLLYKLPEAEARQWSELLTKALREADLG